MDNTTLVILGSIATVIFNILIIAISAVLVGTFGWTAPVIITIILFVFGAVFFDIRLIKYFINKTRKNE